MKKRLKYLLFVIFFSSSIFPQKTPFEFYKGDRIEVLSDSIAFLKFADSSSGYLEMPNIIGSDTIINDYYNLLTFEKVFYAYKNESDYILIGNIWAGKSAAILHLYFNTNSFTLKYAEEIPAIDSLNKIKLNGMYIWEIFSYYASSCEQQVSYRILIFDGRLIKAFEDVKQYKIFTEDEICRGGPSFNTSYNIECIKDDIILNTTKIYEGNKKVNSDYVLDRNRVFIKLHDHRTL